MTTAASPAAATSVPTKSATLPMKKKNTTAIIATRRGSSRIALVRASASAEKSGSSSTSGGRTGGSNGGGDGGGGGKKGVPNNSKYVVPLDKATSGLTRPLAEILRDFNKRVPDNIINHADNSIPWLVWRDSGCDIYRQQKCDSPISSHNTRM